MCEFVCVCNFALMPHTSVAFRSSPPTEMPREDIAPIAEAKETGEAPRAPLRLMTQFLRAVSEGRMEDALALSQTSRRCYCCSVLNKDAFVFSGAREQPKPKVTSPLFSMAIFLYFVKSKQNSSLVV